MVCNVMVIAKYYWMIARETARKRRKATAAAANGPQANLVMLFCATFAFVNEVAVCHVHVICVTSEMGWLGFPKVVSGCF